MFAIVNGDGTVDKVVSGSAVQAQQQCAEGQACHGLSEAQAELVMSVPCALLDGKIVPVDLDNDAEEQARSARLTRDQLLSACDWTQAPDAPVNTAAWAAYRQALRDLPSQPGFPSNINWPVRPEET
ncbi:tail fiber assembly protein [Thalassovita sp.]|uniref:tail fiber assembly protein n=1 Tax=Thalassovita sp. TaxID=1979401 RepID=UPI003B5C101B